MQPEQKINRRALLTATVGAGAAAVLAACSSTSEPSPPHGSASPATGHPRPTTLRRTNSAQPTAPTSADWKAFGRNLNGELFRRGDRGYPAAHQIYDPRFDHIRPTAVASVKSADDVSAAIDFGTHHGLPISLRAGGHSYLGASTGTGLVIDMLGLDSIDVSSGTATFGSGVRLIDAYGTLADHDVSIPGGSCPSVGLTGLGLGGGVGVVARKYGLTCDRFTSLDVVTATGDQLTVSASENPDLFFALRGGGGSFAAVTSLTLQTHPTQSLGVFTLNWDWSHATDVFDAWQSWTGATPDEMWSTCHLLATGDPSSSPSVSVSGVYVGPSSAASPHLDTLISSAGSNPSDRYLANRAYLDTMLLEAGCDHETVDQCHLIGTAPGAAVQRTTFIAASDLYTQQIPRHGIETIVTAVEARQSDPSLEGGGVAFDALGGAVGQIANDATAFAHRAALFGAQWSAQWSVSDPSAQRRNERSLKELQASGHPFADGAYCNYPTAGRKNAAEAYWGANLPRLRQIKAKYDPDGVFNQPQGVTA